jgi:hypothetical protein
VPNGVAAHPDIVADDAWWRDPRFRVPAIFVGTSVLAAASFAVLYAVGNARGWFGERRDDAGFNFGRGYVLCPQASGVSASTKPIVVGSDVVVWLGDVSRNFVQATWARVLDVDAVDQNRIRVRIIGETRDADVKPLARAHGFDIGQAFWITKDCIPDVLVQVNDPRSQVLCGPTLAEVGGPAPEPSQPNDLVGRAVGLVLASKARGIPVLYGTETTWVWQTPIVGRIESVSDTGQIATVSIQSIEAHELADHPTVGHTLRTGDTFDITWDCVVSYGAFVDPAVA